MLETIQSADRRTVEKKSSIYQFEPYLAVKRGGIPIPISFDVIDGGDAVCGFKTRRCILCLDSTTDTYHYPVAHCRERSEQLVSFDHHEVVEVPLDPFQGEGTKEVAVNKRAYLTSGSGALGTVQEKEYRVGTDYLDAEMLKAVD